ncbi:hypothetical protein [Salinisphaera aquimarina]|uniref:PD-(D/E)XK nuclease superfamily protein n=1 Tax=Salinisphaera aquimarina TaxID=2094031 RepID=A0ABV7ESS0_9GAMM
MFKAITHGKMARWIGDDGQPHSAQSVYRDLEDHLTAAVFARLSYLPRDVFWLLLSSALDQVPPQLRHRPSLQSIDFWPTYNHEDGTRCEPDILLRFDDVDVLVEAKRYDDSEWQTRDQLQAEIESYNNEYPDRPDPFCLLVSGRQPSDLSLLENHAGTLRTTWLALRYAARTARDEMSRELDHGHWRRVLQDIEEALGLHGVAPRALFSDLSDTLGERIRRLGSTGQLWVTGTN